LMCAPGVAGCRAGRSQRTRSAHLDGSKAPSHAHAEGTLDTHAWEMRSRSPAHKNGLYPPVGVAGGRSRPAAYSEIWAGGQPHSHLSDRTRFTLDRAGIGYTASQSAD
jgi:hypothetical protein